MRVPPYEAILGVIRLSVSCSLLFFSADFSLLLRILFLLWYFTRAWFSLSGFIYLATCCLTNFSVLCRFFIGQDIIFCIFRFLDSFCAMSLISLGRGAVCCYVFRNLIVNYLYFMFVTERRMNLIVSLVVISPSV